MKILLLTATVLISTFAHAGEKTIQCKNDAGYSMRMIADDENNFLSCSESYPGKAKAPKSVCTPIEMGFAPKNYLGQIGDKLYKSPRNLTQFVIRGYTSSVVRIESGDADTYNTQSRDETRSTLFWIEIPAADWLNSSEFTGSMNFYDEEDGGGPAVDFSCRVSE